MCSYPYSSTSLFFCHLELFSSFALVSFHALSSFHPFSPHFSPYPLFTTLLIYVSKIDSVFVSLLLDLESFALAFRPFIHYSSSMIYLSPHFSPDPLFIALFICVSKIGGVFVVLLCGLALAIVVAILEFCWNSRKNAQTDRVSIFG